MAGRRRLQVGLGASAVMKGDNNRFLGAFRPTEEEVVGRLWLRIPNAGRAIGWLRRPAHAALVAGLLAAVLAGGRSAARRRLRPPTAQTAVGELVLALAASLGERLHARQQPLDAAQIDAPGQARPRVPSKRLHRVTGTVRLQPSADASPTRSRARPATSPGADVRSS